MNELSNSEALALARHAAVTWIQEALKEHFTLVRALHLASQRPWGGQSYSASTLESWHYDFRARGFAALQRKPRKDKGARKALGPEAVQALLALRRQHPHLKIKVLVRQLIEKGTLPSGTFSLPSVYRLLAEHGLDRRSTKNNPHLQNVPTGPTQSFECARSNELWMTDCLFGPTLKRSTGALVPTRLFALLDDSSRLAPHAQYYDSEKLSSFLDCFRQALARRCDKQLNSKTCTDRDYERSDKSS